MKLGKENGSKNNAIMKNQTGQNDMELLLKNLPVLSECFQLHKKIGQGTFSNVYLATLKNSNSTQKYAIKHLVQAFEESKVQNELKCLQEIGGKDNVVSAEYCLSNGNNCVTFIMPYLPHLSFADYVGDMDVEETRLYMKNLFIALKRVHSFNIIHRDVKPGNFLYNRETKQFLLVDFGLAQVVWTPSQNAESNTIFTNENLPINYSKKRKRTSESSCEEFKSLKNSAKRIALKSKDNNKKIWPKNSLQGKFENRNENFDIETSKTQKLKKICLNENLTKINNLKTMIASCGSRPNKLLKIDDEAKNLSGISSTFPKTEVKMKAKIKKNFSKPPTTDCDTFSNCSNMPNTSSFNPCLGKSKRFIWKQMPNCSTSESFSSQRQFPSTSSQAEPCLCSGKGAICFSCSSREKMDAPRAGTSGFRAPEVLFRYLYQNTAVDMWASGVIMLCILCRCYPFFNSSNDLTCLAEIMTVFGTEETIKVANKFGRRIICSENRKAVDLKKLCNRLRARSTEKTKKSNHSNEIKCRDCLQTIKRDGCLCPSEESTEQPICDQSSSANTSLDVNNETVQFPDSAFDLLKRLLDLDPTTRITAKEALEHPFITGH